MGRKKISTTVYITETQNEKLKQLNQKTKVPIAEYIRQGIDMVLKLNREHIPGQMSFDEDLEDAHTQPRA
ncbi:MAG: transcriptional regulator [Deltaproteobacteria bacterium RIFCSPHIGHO2_02_FULL_40_11]|nr:MAG: transcriptional regulator [Deltaproteobacteria bacterium RIFCSPHIGHO2_02_FULL_40_11]